MTEYPVVELPEFSDELIGQSIITYNRISTKVYGIIPILSEDAYIMATTGVNNSGVIQTKLVAVASSELARFLGSLYVVNGMLIRGITDPVYPNNVIIQYSGDHNLIFQPEVPEVSTPGKCTVTITNTRTDQKLTISNEEDPTILTLQSNNNKYFLVIPSQTFPSADIYEIRVETEKIPSDYDSNIMIPKYGRFTYEINNNINITRHVAPQLTESELANFAKALGVGQLKNTPLSGVSDLITLVTKLRT